VTVDRRQDAATTVAELERLLLDAKLSIPQPRPGAVSRAQLIETGRASDCRVVAITAPAGYGKSTLLAEWADGEDRQIAWVSLDRFDDDPAVLLTLLASAYARIVPGNASLIADMSGLGVSALGRAAPLLASVLGTSPFPFVLMLDDLHELQSPACHDVLGVVISGIPGGSQLVTASRSEQPHLPRLRASGDAVEFLGSDLALDVAGAEQIFAAAHVHLTRERAAAVTEQTEGWPVGLYLAAVIARDSHGEALTVSGDDRYVADYLYRESLMSLPEHIQRFLRRTAVLDQLCAPLCDAILEESGGQQRLRVLEALSLFLIPLDRRREWYRYHALFREFLLGELRRVEPEVIMKLQLRAANWYEANGSPALAVEHLLNSTEQDRCVQMVTALILPTYQAGQLSTVQRWLSALGDSAIEDYPPLAVLAGYIAVFTGETAEALRWAAIVDAASFDQVPADGTASFDSARAMFRAVICAAGPEQMMTDASFAVAQEPPWSVWRDTALCFLAEAHLLTGDLDQASALFAESSTLAAAMGNTDSFVDSEAELALLAMDGGRWAEAAGHVELALAAIDKYRMRDYITSVLAFAVAARLAVHRGDLTEADRQLTQAMRARPTCTFVLPWLAVRARLQLAKVYWATGDQSTARTLLREIDDVLFNRPALGALIEEVSEFRRIVTSSTHMGATGGSPLSPAELRLLPYLQTHLTFGEIGERLFVSRNTVSTEVASIYRKLNVSSRNDAVQHASAIGLLGG
jgi:LuxR family transcriptional regulator, maltose regulon positive regulatory protein